MVQQPASYGLVAGLTNMQQQQQVATGNNSNTQLALPAIIGGGDGSVASQQQQVSQYSPQADLYQQQLIKGAQQFVQQQQVNQYARQLNGPTTLPSPQQQQQQVSPQQQQQQQQQRPQTNGLESLYNGIQHAPIYAPKPTYYPKQQPQTSQQHQQSMYQAARQVQQQQGFYATNQAAPTITGGLSVRQLPQATPPTSLQLQASGILVPATHLSPMQPNGLTYQQNAESILQQQQQAAYLNQPKSQQVGGQSIRGWPQQHLVHEQDLTQRRSQLFAPIASERQFISTAPVAMDPARLQHNQQPMMQLHHKQASYNHQNQRPTCSDRDSISTLSRFNQFDERRSFTMRSQYTSANRAINSGPSNRFGFLELTGEAMRRILGFGGHNGNAEGGDSQAAKLLLGGSSTVDHQDKQQVDMLNRNLSLATATDTLTTNNNNNNNNNKQNGNKVTTTVSIDSAEDYYFKRQVFKYQLVILRLLNFLCCSFVLLSPVAMLIIPKMEFLLHSSQASSSSHLLNQDSSLDSSSNLQDTASGSSSATSTHSVSGLSGINRLPVGRTLYQQNQNSVAIAGGASGTYYTPQPQWRISDCNSSDCDGPLVGFVIRYILLCVAYWAIYFRPQSASLPRLDFQRCFLISLAVLITLAYWLFFTFRVFDKRYNDFELQYMSIVQFSVSMLESLILLHYLAIVLLELRHRKKVYCLKVIRSPDGEAHYYRCGSLSVQKCAQFILDKYHCDFKHYGPYTEELLQLEDQWARQQVGSGSRLARERGEISADGDLDDDRPRSRANSPANSQRGRRSSSRHHRHRSGDRSPSPARSTRSKSARKSRELRNDSEPDDNQTEAKKSVYQLDASPKLTGSGGADRDNEKNKSTGTVTSENGNGSESANNTADQSSDGTTKMKESSLETIRPANSTSDLLVMSSNNNNQPSGSQQQPQKSIMKSTSRSQLAVDETESVRSGRSRKSTSHRHHSHHRERSSSHHHRERSSSRMAAAATTATEHSMASNEQRNPLDEHERKLRRRKSRLLVNVQETFERLKRIEGEDAKVAAHQLATNGTTNESSTNLSMPLNTMNPNQAARTMYPSIARSLQKYLRITKQTGRHNLQSIYEHLAKCLLYKLSARAFIEKFVNHDPVWQQSETNLFAHCTLEDSAFIDTHRSPKDLEINSWSLVSDTLASRHIDSGTFFVLKQGQVSLLVNVAKLPHLNLTEEVVDLNSCKFAPRINA